ncbi:hypothetical protein ACTXT7_004806 [Hymenolepis weldensis]
MLTPVFKHFPGYMGCLIFGVLFAMLVPMVGIFFCCIRCCGRCGGRLTPMDRKADPCRRVCYTITLALLITVQLAAIVLCFINYQLYYESLTSKDPSIGVIPQFQLSSREFQYGMTEVLNAAKNSSSVDLVAQKQRFDAVFDVGLSDFQRDFVGNSSAAAVMKEKETLQQERLHNATSAHAVYRFAAGSRDSNSMKDFISLLEKVEMELPFIKTTISDILNTECTVNQLSACRELRFTTDNDLKVAYTMDQHKIRAFYCLYDASSFKLLAIKPRVVTNPTTCRYIASPIVPKSQKTEFQTKDITAFLQILENVQNKVKELDEFDDPLLKMKENVKKAIQPILDAIPTHVMQSAGHQFTTDGGYLWNESSHARDAWNDLSNSPKTREDLVKSLQGFADYIKSFLSVLDEPFIKYTSSEKPLFQ